MVPCGRLSWLLVSFWAHVNIVHHIRYRCCVLVQEAGTAASSRRPEVRRHGRARPTRSRAPSYLAARRLSSSTNDSNRSASTSSADRVLSWYCPSLTSPTRSCFSETMKLRFSMFHVFGSPVFTARRSASADSAVYAVVLSVCRSHGEM